MEVWILSHQHHCSLTDPFDPTINKVQPRPSYVVQTAKVVSAFTLRSQHSVSTQSRAHPQPITLQLYSIYLSLFATSNSSFRQYSQCSAVQCSAIHFLFTYLHRESSEPESQAQVLKNPFLRNKSPSPNLLQLLNFPCFILLGFSYFVLSFQPAIPVKKARAQRLLKWGGGGGRSFRGSVYRQCSCLGPANGP